MKLKSLKRGVRLLALALMIAAAAAASAQAAEFHVGEAHSLLRGKATVKTSFTGPAGFATTRCAVGSGCIACTCKQLSSRGKTA